jgi:probable O-glycosylation ligase (exosortase A-associated)
MRDFLIVVIVLGSVPLTLVRPQIGILMWFWLSLMNPHRWAWGYAQTFRVALVAGLATIIGWLFSREAKAPPNSFIVYALALFTLWVTLAAFFAIHPDVAIAKWEEIIKILLMTFVTMCIVQTRERIIQLAWVVAVSIGIYGVKGGLFAIGTGGHYRVWGPDGSFISDNNSLACALIMVLPLLQFLRVVSTRSWIKLGLLGAMGLNVISILASYSRGAFLGLTITLGYLLLKTRYRFVTLLVTVGVLAGALYVAPEAWFERMGTIEHYQQDESAEGRLQAWRFAFLLALDHPLLGGGELVGEDPRLFMHYVPQATQSRAAHSIYFQILGETGFVGLAIYLVLLLSSLLAARDIIRLTRDKPELAWARSLAAMLQVSIIGYSVTAAFLSLGFFDLYYALVALVAVTHLVVRREIAKTAGNTAPAKLGAWKTRLPVPMPGRPRPAIPAASRSPLAGS